MSNTVTTNKQTNKQIGIKMIENMDMKMPNMRIKYFFRLEKKDVRKEQVHKKYAWKNVLSKMILLNWNEIMFSTLKSMLLFVTE